MSNERKQRMQEIDSFLSSFDSLEAGMTAYELGLSFEEASAIGYK